jgi:CRISPR-associated protein Cas1
MTRSHIIDIASSPTRLSVSLDCLVIACQDSPQKRLQLSDLAVLIVSHPQVTYTQAVLSQLAENGGVFVTCSSSRMPNGMLLPLAANSTQTERFVAQTQAPKPLRKRLWQQITRCKIESQARALEYVHGSDSGLRQLKSKVRSGDPSNVEAQAARRYWQRLFGEKNFKRQFTAQDENQFLNYGYAVLRAIVARAICASGLHPTIGLHHHNRYNAFCLADDLMEPLRPLVDIAVVRLGSQLEVGNDLTSTYKKRIITAITAKQKIASEERDLFDLASRMSSSLAQVFSGERSEIELPQLTFEGIT